MPQLYAVFLGGRALKCNTELHDVVFVVGESLEETYPLLVNKWFGVTKQLHIDASIKLDHVDAYDIVVSKEKPDNVSMELYFVNFGAYKSGYFGEVHESSFYVASSRQDASAKAKKQLCLSLSLPHCDDNQLVNNLIMQKDLSVDDVLAIKKVDNYFIHLIPGERSTGFDIQFHYQKLDLPEIIEQAQKLAVG